MTKPTQINGLISLASNTPGTPTGYGQQGELFVTRAIRHGIKVAAMTNYGREGNIGTAKVGDVEIPEFPRGYNLYSDDVLPLWHKQFSSEYPDRKAAIMTLYDVWVYNQLNFRNLYPDGEEPPILAWTPLDHITLPPMVAQFLKRPNVYPITMAEHGQRQLEANGIASYYIPHAVDTKVYRPKPTVFGVNNRTYLGVKPNDFVVGIFAANKAAGELHRKAFGENLLAFSLFAKDKPGVKLYIHAEPTRVFGGFHLPTLLQSLGIQPDQVIFPDPLQFRIGYPVEEMAGLYSALNVLLATSYGEGFGVCGIEAQACGVRVITSDFAATADLASPDSWKVDGQPFWHESQSAFFKVPAIPEIVKALEEAYDVARKPSEEAVKFASQFDAEHVWQTKWLPYLSDFFK
jgi:glycosyltransferase involved in cell wall biosynthesis